MIRRTTNYELSITNYEIAGGRPFAVRHSPFAVLRTRQRTTTLSLLLFGAWLSMSALPAPAQPREAAKERDPVHPLALKEEMIRDRFDRFEDRLFRLREQLVESEPDNAGRLRRVLDRAGALGLQDQLDQLVELLRDPASLHSALDVQSAWLADADRLLAILLERDSDNEDRKNEIERLQAYNEKLDELLREERALRSATGQTGMTAQMLEQLDQAIRRIQALMDRQAEVSQATGQASTAPTPSSEQLDQRQTALSREAAELADDLRKLGGAKPEESADTPELEAARQDTQAAAQAMQSGAKSMSEASGSMKAGESGGAQQQQQEAEEALREAKQRLEEAKRRLEEKTDTEKIAEQQQKVAEATERLSDQMKQDASEGGQQGQQGGQSGSSSPSPGQQSVDQAQKEMNDAAQSLGEQNPQEATPSQDRAIEELEQAKKELEEALSQLRQEEKEETLRDLESRFREMLAKQRGINETTIQLDTIGGERFKRAERLELADLSSKQRALSQDAASCLHILDEDGTTIVFPRVVQQISEDMETVADRLARYKAAAFTQSIEAEIIDALEQLLEAVQQMQQENEQQGDPMDGDAGESPLLPPSAELKLLRASQTRTNSRTTSIETARTQETDSKTALAEAARAVASRQLETAKIAEEMRDQTLP